ncbi:MAG: O-acetylhomoserine aminocarboxypropyltransferase/cysteine synthase [Planctomycetia bacterium]|jgi:O-acetylhomoserine (thiol)-lyase
MTTKKSPLEKPGLSTRALHAGYEIDPTTGACAVPIYQSASYHFASSDHAADLFDLKELGWIYTRIGNPTTDVFEQRMASLEGGVGAVAFSSGQQAATVSILNLAHAGSHVVAANALYGGTLTLFGQTFKRLGVKVTFVDVTNPQNIAQAIRPETKAVFIEALANPKNDVLDYRSIADIAHAEGVPVVCDNTVLTPVVFRPFEHGIDISMYSTTKFIGGHGTSIGGIVVDSGQFDWAASGRFPQFTEPDPFYHGIKLHEHFGDACYIASCRTHWLRDLGGVMSPFNAFQFLQGLETLALRMPRHCENALALAQFLEKHEAVTWVNYPGLSSHPGHQLAQKYFEGYFGAILGFGIKGGRAAGKRFIESVQLASHLANLGDAKTLVIHPASTTHRQLSEDELQKAGITEDYIRVSVGLEDSTDILADFEHALQASQNG